MFAKLSLSLKERRRSISKSGDELTHKTNTNVYYQIRKPAKCTKSLFSPTTTLQFSVSVPFLDTNLGITQRIGNVVLKRAYHHTVEPRNSGNFGHPDFFRYCGVFRYLEGDPFYPKKHTMTKCFQYTSLFTFFNDY